MRLFRPDAQSDRRISMIGGVLADSNDCVSLSARRFDPLWPPSTNSIASTMTMNQNDNADRVRTAVADRDVSAISELVSEMQFLLIHVADSNDPEDELGALTAEIEDQPCLVAFTSEENASAFVQQHPDVFSEGEEVSGMLVDGATMLDYLGDDYGLLIDPETESGAFVDRELVGDLLDELDLE